MVGNDEHEEEEEEEEVEEYDDDATRLRCDAAPSTGTQRGLSAMAFVVSSFFFFFFSCVSA